jgi:hypothetical protein
MLGGVVELGGAVFLQDSLAISHIPCAMVFVHTAVLITETCFHDDSICGLSRNQYGPPLLI